MTTRTILVNALGVIEPGGRRFTTGALARNQQGEKVQPTSPYATCFCAIGAVLKVGGRDRIPDDGPIFDAVELLDLAAQEQGYMAAYRCADRGGRVAALQMFRRALARHDKGPPTRATNDGSTT